MSDRSSPLAWGRVHRFSHATARPCDADTAMAALRAFAGPALAYGRGRSYGDSCLNEGGLLLDTGGLDRFVAFNPRTGQLEVQAGVSLAEILACVCRPDRDGSAWFPPVTPGTRWVSIGGALANDVHGKNHHRHGSFGCHVPAFTLLRSDGRILRCSTTENEELYRATIGGLGLTGLILTVDLQLRRVPGLMLLAEDIRFGSLEEFYGLAAESEAAWEYTVAWIDCLAQGRGLGRGIFSRANHIPGPIGPTAPIATRWAVPFALPVTPMNRLTLSLFNAIYWRKLGLRQHMLRVVPYATSLFPLDAVGGWNRLYGSQGFYQYQCVLPPATARDGIGELLESVARAGEGSFLAILKTMGQQSSTGLLAFSREGTTLTLDFPNRGASTLALLDGLDAITLRAGGRVYPAKDGRMSPAMFAAGYPELARFRRSIDPAFSSSFWRRVAGSNSPFPPIPSRPVPITGVCVIGPLHSADLASPGWD